MLLEVEPNRSQASEVKLLHDIARGDEGALARLYDQYRVILFGLLMRILNNREEAEDVLQDVFLQVWRRAHDFDETRGKPFTWLVTLARSRGIDRLRQLAARQRLATSVAQDQPEEASDALSATFKSEQRQTVTRALAELPEDQRKALMLAYYDGLTQSEIASKLNAPLGTIKTRMRAGLMKLRGIMMGQAESFG
jgi:RNA polymerase sigma-70 factor, ECF subfamily